MVFDQGCGAHDALDALFVGLKGKKVNWVRDADIRDSLIASPMHGRCVFSSTGLPIREYSG